MYIRLSILHPKRKLIIAATAFAVTRLVAQDVERVIGDTRTSLQDPVSVNGSVSANSVLYRSFGIAPRRDPYYWVVSANLNFTVLDKIHVPFTAVFTQQDKNFTNGLDKFSQPFNQFGLSPSYRWLTVHAGYRSMDFSEYSLSGALWLGGGIEIKPQRSLVTGSAFYGRFLKAVPQGGVDGIVVSLPSYERLGGGAKLRVGNEVTFAELVVLRISDVPNSIPFDTLLDVTPQQNQIVSVGARHRLFKWMTISGEVALSMFTKNLYQEEYHPEQFSWLSQYFITRPSTELNKVINGSIDFSPGKLRLGLRYKRIDPGYRSLGAIFLTNDVEELSINSGIALFNNKLSLNAATGLQRNNLDRKQTLTSERVIGSLNTSYRAGEHVNLGLSFSNFSSNTTPQRDVFTDSIRFVQVTGNLGSNVSFSFGGNLKQQITICGTYQESQGTQQALSKFYNSTASYQLNISETGWSAVISALYNQLDNSEFGSSQGVGPQLYIQKSTADRRLRIAVSAGYQDTYLNASRVSRNISGNSMVQFTINKRQKINFDFSFLDRLAVSLGVQSFREIRANIGYTYGFSGSVKSLKKKK